MVISVRGNVREIPIGYTDKRERSTFCPNRFCSDIDENCYQGSIFFKDCQFSSVIQAA